MKDCKFLKANVISGMIVYGKQGKIVFGDGFRVTCGFKIVSMCGIMFGEQVLFGWGNVVIDSNFHPLYDMEKEKSKKPSLL